MLDTDFAFQDFDWANYSPTDFNPSVFNEYIPAPDPPAYVPPAYDPPASAPASVDYYDWAGYSPTDFAPAPYNDYIPAQETVAYVPAPLEYDVGPDYNPPEYNPSTYNDYVPAQETVAYVPAQQTATYVPAPLEYTDWSGYNLTVYNPFGPGSFDVSTNGEAGYFVAVGPAYDPTPNDDVVNVNQKRVWVPLGYEEPRLDISAYGGLTGVEDNDRRMQMWVNMSPSQRAEYLGYSSVARITPPRDGGDVQEFTTLELPDDDDFGLMQVGWKPSIGLELALEFFFTPNPVNRNDPGIWRENALSAAYPKLPTNWAVRLSRPGTTGLVWHDPNDAGTSVRVMQGKPDAIYPSQRVDYVKVQINGASVQSDGTRLQGGGNEPSAHIPLIQWLTWPSWSSPR